MKFHAIHGYNVTIDENGSRACRTSSFCDAITFSGKPLAVNGRVSLLLGINEDWTGTLRIGVTTHDPSTFLHKRLPRYACPDLTSKSGFWARPLPEAWISNGTKLTFYVNSKGHFHLFINGEHKGAILSGLPTNQQLWLILDLYGTTVSVKFISNSGIAPSEVLARGPEAIQAYQNALNSGSTPYFHTRVALIGPPDGKKSILKKLLVNSSGEDNEAECERIDPSFICKSSEISNGRPWIVLGEKNQNHDDPNNNDAEIKLDEIEACDQDSKEYHQLSHSEEEYFKAIAVNIVREIVLQKKLNKEERRKTPVTKSAFKLQTSSTKIGSSKSKQEESMIGKDFKNISTAEDLPTDLPSQVVDLVEMMLKEPDKQMWEKKENERLYADSNIITFSIWNYAGHLKSLFFHQLFLSPQTIYLFVFNLAQDLEVPILSDDCSLEHPASCKLSYLSLLHIWLEMIYVSIAHPKDESKNKIKIPENQINDIICTLFPPVLIVGVQEDSTTYDSLVEHQFNKIKESIQDKVYYHLVHPTFYYVGSPETVAVDSMISELRTKIQELCLQLPHVGSEIPLKWMLFEQAIDRLIERDVYFADLDKLSEVARLENIDSDEEFYSMIHFYHHQGKIWHLGSDMLLGKDDGCGIVILKPQWFIDYIYELMDSNSYHLLKENSELEENKDLEDIFTSNSFEKLWPNSFHYSSILLDILDSTDVLCEIITEDSDNSQPQNYRTYMIPWLMDKQENAKGVSEFQGLVLILDFCGLLPVGFFTKLTVRLFRWSKRHHWKRNLSQICNKGSIPVDYNHCMKLQKTFGHRIQISLIQRLYLETDEGVKLSFPAPHVCLKVRHLLEREIEHLKDVWYKRISYSINVPCPCEKTCNLHAVSKCTDSQCVHLLPLNDCLSKKVIECDYRLLKTDFIQKFFNPSMADSPRYSNSIRLSVDGVSTPFLGNFFWSEHDITGDEPHWLKHVGNSLTSVNTGQDWIALAKRLGYSEREIRRFNDETYPSITLLNDWINSNGRTRFCIDMLIACLEQMGRKDVINCILLELGPELPSPPVFISYQWESQQAVLHIRRQIELAGYPCWMDVGHIVGGDTLYGKIYEGINKSKVVLCFLTPRYVLSPLCTREMSLADILRKPIVPVMLEPTPWPPPGALALILSSLVYIDLCGVGGHGGCGRQADLELRFRSILERLSHYISPSFSSQLTTISSSERIMPPSTTTVIPNHDFVDATEQNEEREVHNPDVPLPDEDILSEEISAHEPDSPTVWNPTHRNRVVRCSICTIL